MAFESSDRQFDNLTLDGVHAMLRQIVGTALAVSLASLSALGDDELPSYTVQVDRVMPFAAKCDGSCDLTFVGEGLQDVMGLWTTFPCQATPISRLTQGESVAHGDDPGSQVSIRVDVPHEVRPQLAVLRLITMHGVSEPILTMLDDLPSETDAGQNHSRAEAQEIVLPIAVDGVLESTHSDWYALVGDPGQPVTVEIVAARIGSPVDPVVRTTDTNGREIAYEDDTPAMGGDCQLAFEMPDDGKCLIEVTDVRYDGGEEYRYRLRCGHFPLLAGAYPLAVQGNGPARVDLFNPHRKAWYTRSLAVEQLVARAVRPLAAKWTPSLGSGFTSVLVSNLEEFVEQEPNDASESATRVVLPSALNGRFEEPADVDWFEFSIEAPTRIHLAPRHASLGVETLVHVQLFDESGELLGELAATDHQRVLEMELAVPGIYRLSVRELLRRHGPRRFYRLELQERVSPFELTVEHGSVNVPRGGVFSVNVTSRRRGYEGPIQLFLDGFGDRVGLENAVIEKEADETQLRVRVDDGPPAGGFREFRIGGYPARDVESPREKPVWARSLGMQGIRAKFVSVEYPFREWAERMVLGVGPPFPRFFQLTTLPKRLWAVPGAERLLLEVELERLLGFTGDVQLVLTGLPDGMECEAAKIAAGQSSTYLTFTGTAALSPGDYTIQITGQGSLENQTSVVRLDDINLHIGDPVDVDVSLDGPLSRQSVVTATVKVHRHTDDRNPVELQWMNLPPGVEVASGISIAAEEVETSVQFKVASDARIGEYPDVRVLASTHIAPTRTSNVEPTSIVEIWGDSSLSDLGDLREAEDFDDGNASVVADGSGEGIGIVSDQGGQATYLEYSFNVPEPGEYQLELRYAAAQSRPARLIVNGELKKANAMAEITGGWMPGDQRWFHEGRFLLSAGRNVVRLETSSVMSHLDKLLVAPSMDVHRLSPTFDSWVQAGGGTSAEELDGNLVSVFGPESAHGGRYGVLEFDANELSGLRIHSARLEMGVDGRERPLARGSAHSVARLLPVDTEALSLTGSAVESLRENSVVFQGLGAFQIEAGDSLPAGQYERSDTTTSSDLDLLTSRLEMGNAMLALVLEAHPEHPTTARDWGADDGGEGGTRGGPLPARLVVLAEPVDSTGDREGREVTVESQSLTLMVE